MALLTAAQLLDARKKFADRVCKDRDGLALSKPDLAAAISAIDQWVESNASAFNSAIPQPARGVLTSKQKAELLSIVALLRFSAL